jgi:predicted Fe-S protein YdhL (DUF1289 family)
MSSGMDAADRVEAVKKDNPCISLCEFDGRTGWCLGCGRTIPEIREWRKLTLYRRTALLRELPRRVIQVRTDVQRPSQKAGKRRNFPSARSSSPTV